MAKPELIRGLARFQEHFRNHVDQYVLIGGSAAALTMDDAGLEFRATKDFDIVLHVEVLSAQFINDFWEFIKLGKYAVAERSDGSPTFYRFHKPQDDSFPEMLELFSRKPDGLALPADAHLTPIPAEEEVSSLSAILLDPEYYDFLMAGRREAGGLVWAGEDRLIPLKASAWVDMTRRAKEGASIDSKKIRKHRNDVLRLVALLAPESKIDLPPSIRDDLRHFVGELRACDEADLRSLNMDPAAVYQACDRLAGAYGL